MGTKQNPSEFDCYAKAALDEPMFVLLARDKYAPSLIWLWATLRELDGEDSVKVAEARNIAEEMIDYAVNHNRMVAGLAQITLGGVFELIRVANMAATQPPKNEATADDSLRLWLARTNFEE